MLFIRYVSTLVNSEPFRSQRMRSVPAEQVMMYLPFGEISKPIVSFLWPWKNYLYYGLSDLPSLNFPAHLTNSLTKSTLKLNPRSPLSKLTWQSNIDIFWSVARRCGVSCRIPLFSSKLLDFDLSDFQPFLSVLVDYARINITVFIIEDAIQYCWR